MKYIVVRADLPSLPGQGHSQGGINWVLEKQYFEVAKRFSRYPGRGAEQVRQVQEPQGSTLGTPFSAPARRQAG